MITNGGLSEEMFNDLQISLYLARGKERNAAPELYSGGR